MSKSPATSPVESGAAYQMGTKPLISLRWIVLALGSIEAVICFAFIALLLRSSDPLGKAIGQGAAKLAMVPLMLCVLPSLALGIANRRLSTALILACLAIPVAWVLWSVA